jgi:hypothetical protein
MLHVVRFVPASPVPVAISDLARRALPSRAAVALEANQD